MNPKTNTVTAPITYGSGEAEAFNGNKYKNLPDIVNTNDLTIDQLYDLFDCHKHNRRFRLGTQRR